MDINKETLLKGFASYVEAKRKQALYLKLFFVSITMIILTILYYSYSIVNNALDKVIVVNTGGELLPMESMEQETLYAALIQTHCYSVSYLANSFDVNNIKNNQARAAFLVNQADLNAVIDKYQYDKAYSDAINKGVVYRCSFEKVNRISQIGNGSEYDVVFTSTLSVISNIETKNIRIVSKGTAIRTTPRYPENPTGFYFKYYIQEYYPI
jgi:hypothetical protein